MSQSGLGFLCSQLILEESSSCLPHETVVSVSGSIVLWVPFLELDVKMSTLKLVLL